MNETPERAEPSHTLWRCRRCQSDEAIEHPSPGVFVLDAVEHRATLRTHSCVDGQIGVMDLRGTCTPAAKTAPADAGVVVVEKPKGRMVGAERAG